MKAVWNGEVLAESNHTKVVENNHYFPPETINDKYFQLSDTHSTCPWKGKASYFHIQVGEDKNADAAWFYHHPKDAAKEIKDHVAFWKGVKIEE
jgi:uncharacterized protein (DUF427 family)